MPSPTPFPRQRFFDADGAPLALGFLYPYAAGTTSPLATYQDSAGGTPNTHPIALDANGECVLWLGDSGAYDFRLTNAAGVDQPAPGLNVQSVARTISTSGVSIQNRLASPSVEDDGDAMIGWGAITATVAGVRTRYATLAAAVTAVGSTKAAIVVRNAVTVAADTTIPTTCLLHVVDDGLITTNSGITLTINGGLNCPPVQCFTGSGTVAFGERIRNVWPEWWGAVADGNGSGGGTNNYTAINKAISAISAMSKRATVRLIDGGIYRCDTGLSIDVSIHSFKSVGAMLDFYGMSSGYALTLNATADLEASGSFYAATNCFEGIILKGREGASSTSPPSVTRNGILIAGTVSGVVTGYKFSRCVFRNWSDLITLANTANAQAVTFEDCNYLWSTRNVYFPLAVSGAAGSKMVFRGGFMTGGVTAFDLESTVAQTIVDGLNIEGMTENVFYHLGGLLEVCGGTHIETGGSAPDCYIYRAQSGQSGYANVSSAFSMSDTQIIVKGSRNVPVFDLSKRGSWHISGGVLNADGATHAVPIFDSDGSGEGIGVLSIDGLALDKVSADTVFGVASTISIKDDWGAVRGLAAGDYSAVNQGTTTITPTSLTTTGSPT
jgi:hypothetical protein